MQNAAMEVHSLLRVFAGLSIGDFIQKVDEDDAVRDCAQLVVARIRVRVAAVESSLALDEVVSRRARLVEELEPGEPLDGLVLNLHRLRVSTRPSGTRYPHHFEEVGYADLTTRGRIDNHGLGGKLGVMVSERTMTLKLTAAGTRTPGKGDQSYRPHCKEGGKYIGAMV